MGNPSRRDRILRSAEAADRGRSVVLSAGSVVDQAGASVLGEFRPSLVALPAAPPSSLAIAPLSDEANAAIVEFRSVRLAVVDKVLLEFERDLSSTLSFLFLEGRFGASTSNSLVALGKLSLEIAALLTGPPLSLVDTFFDVVESLSELDAPPAAQFSELQFADALRSVLMSFEASIRERVDTEEVDIRSFLLRAGDDGLDELRRQIRRLRASQDRTRLSDERRIRGAFLQAWWYITTSDVQLEGLSISGATTAQISDYPPNNVSPVVGFFQQTPSTPASEWISQTSENASFTIDGTQPHGVRLQTGRNYRDLERLISEIQLYDPSWSSLDGYSGIKPLLALFDRTSVKLVSLSPPDANTREVLIAAGRTHEAFVASKFSG